MDRYIDRDGRPPIRRQGDWGRPSERQGSQRRRETSQERLEGLRRTHRYSGNDPSYGNSTEESLLLPIQQQRQRFQPRDQQELQKQFDLQKQLERQERFDRQEQWKLQEQLKLQERLEQQEQLKLQEQLKERKRLEQRFKLLNPKERDLQEERKRLEQRFKLPQYRMW